MTFSTYLLYLLLCPLSAWTSMLIAGWLHADVWQAVPLFGYGPSLLLSVCGITLWFLIGLVFRGIEVVLD